MFQLLQPIWLFALAGLSIPVIIHLWNQQPGRTLRVGSIVLVAENAVTYKKRVKLAEILLLLLRCLLLACIAVALAGPCWRSPVNKLARGWVLMSRAQLASTYQYFKPQVDSLLQAGLEFHYFNEGFEKLPLADALQQPADSNNVQPSYRRLVALLNQEVDATMPVYLFTDNLLRNFAGARSAVSLNLHWKTYTPQKVSTVPRVDTTPLRIALYSNQYCNDLRYLKAALEAIQQFSKRKIIIQSFSAASEITTQQDWLFWLAAEAAGTSMAKNIVQYAPGKGSSNISYVLPSGKLSFDAIDLYAAVIEKDSAVPQAEIYWQDGFGRPLLALTRKAKANYYWLYTHIDPAWNELPWSGNFPQLLHELLYTDTVKKEFADPAAIIDSNQLLPLLQTAKKPDAKPVVFKVTRLASIFWLTAFLLFFAERLLSFYHRKTSGND